jgi:hypothetical protein
MQHSHKVSRLERIDSYAPNTCKVKGFLLRSTTTATAIATATTYIIVGSYDEAVAPQKLLCNCDFYSVLLKSS